MFLIAITIVKALRKLLSRVLNDSLPANSNQIDLPLVEYNCEMAKYSNDACSICFKEFLQGDLVKKTTCSHIFCKECIDSWFQYSQEPRCPNCNQNPCN